MPWKFELFIILPFMFNLPFLFYFIFLYKIEILLYLNLSVYTCEAPSWRPKPWLLPPYLISTYTCEVTIVPRMCGDAFLFYHLVPICFNFPNPKSPFWNYKYKKPVWLGIKSNFLEKVAFWICEENAHS